MLKSEVSPERWAKYLEDQRGYRARNSDKNREYQRCYRAVNPDKVRDYMRGWRARNRGKLREQFRARFSAKVEAAAGRPRSDVCEVCSRHPGKSSLHFDHDHRTGKFRGWLCSNCNTALGFVKDSPAILRALIDYLERVK